MEVIFRTNQLQRCYEDSSRATRQWGPDVARQYILRVNRLYAISNFQEAYNIQSFHLHPLRSSGRGELSIRLTGRWRLIVTKGNTEESVTIEEVSDHYDD